MEMKSQFKKKIKLREETLSKAPIAMEDFPFVEICLSGGEAIRTQSFREHKSLRGPPGLFEE